MRDIFLETCDDCGASYDVRHADSDAFRCNSCAIKLFFDRLEWTNLGLLGVNGHRKPRVPDLSPEALL